MKQPAETLTSIAVRLRKVGEANPATLDRQLYIPQEILGREMSHVVIPPPRQSLAYEEL